MDAENAIIRLVNCVTNPFQRIVAGIDSHGFGRCTTAGKVAPVYLPVTLSKATGRLVDGAKTEYKCTTADPAVLFR